MDGINKLPGKRSAEHAVPDMKDLEEVVNEIFESALNDAKSQLHPLLRHSELSHLSQRTDFLRAFKSALEKRLTRILVAWLPEVEAVYQYDETRLGNIENWDGSIRLLLKVPRLSNVVRTLGKKLDRDLVNYLRQLGWQRVRTRQSILEIHQVTPGELRHGTGYGAMFFAVHTAPVQVWPQDQRAR